MAKQNVKAGAFQLAQQVAQQGAADKAKEEQTPPSQTQPGVNDESNTGGTEDVSAQGEGSVNDKTDGSSEDNSQGAQDDVVEEAIITIPITPVAPVAAPVAAKAIVVEKTQPVAANATLTEKLATILKDVPGAHQTDISRVLTYLERMAPNRPIDTKQGCAEQIALYRAIQNIINRQETYFTQLFSALLFIFKSEAKGALGDRYRMRFMDNIQLAAGDRKAFAHLTQAFSILADPQSRDLAIRQVNMEMMLANGLTAAGQQRVLHYFGA